jgi:hypothetical protein
MKKPGSPTFLKEIRRLKQRGEEEVKDDIQPRGLSNNYY